jgi:hypothetical protein
MNDVEAELAEHLAVLRDALKPEDGTQEDYSLCAVETFAAVAIRDHARKLLESPRGLSKEALTWAKNLANKRTTT